MSGFDETDEPPEVDLTNSERSRLPVPESDTSPGGDGAPDGDDSATVSSDIARSTASLTMRRFGLIGISFISTLFITRKLGPSGYGALQSGLATWGIIVALCDFGVSLALSREMAKDPASQPSLLRATYWVQGAWSVLLTLVMVVVALLTGGSFSQHSEILLVLAPSVLVTAFSSGRNLFLVRYEMGYVVMVDLVTTSIQVAVMIAVAMLGYGPVAVAAVISAGTIVSSIWIGGKRS